MAAGPRHLACRAWTRGLPSHVRRMDKSLASQPQEAGAAGCGATKTAPPTRSACEHGVDIVLAQLGAHVEVVGVPPDLDAGLARVGFLDAGLQVRRHRVALLVRVTRDVHLVRVRVRVRARARARVRVRVRVRVRLRVSCRVMSTIPSVQGTLVQASSSSRPSTAIDSDGASLRATYCTGYASSMRQSRTASGAAARARAIACSLRAAGVAAQKTCRSCWWRGV
eukprot:scaffold29901_cov63-Phaeocystis_antarctica.AAC.3